MSTPDTTIPQPTATPKKKGSGRRRPTVDELRQRELPADRLWTIEEVAAFLQCCVREAEDVVKEPTVPQPRLSRGRLRRWSPTQWRQWEVDGSELHVPNATSDDEGDDDVDAAAFGDV